MRRGDIYLDMGDRGRYKDGFLEKVTSQLKTEG